MSIDCNLCSDGVHVPSDGAAVSVHYRTVSLSVSARNGILKEVLSLKRTVRKSNVNALHRTIGRRRRKRTFSGGNDDEKGPEIRDDRRSRKYLKIWAIDNAPNWGSVSAANSVSSILEQFSFRKESERDLIDSARCVLKHSVKDFVIVIYDATTWRHFYLFTKHRIREWSVQNVHRVMV